MWNINLENNSNGNEQIKNKYNLIDINNIDFKIEEEIKDNNLVKFNLNNLFKNYKIEGYKKDKIIKNKENKLENLQIYKIRYNKNFVNINNNMNNMLNNVLIPNNLSKNIIYNNNKRKILWLLIQLII